MPTTYDGVATLVGSSFFTIRAGLRKPGSMTLGGLGSLFPNAVRVQYLSAVLAGSGSLSAFGVKPPNRIGVRFAGSGSMSVVAVAPRLVASARFVGSGSMSLLENTATFVMSTKNTHRLGFPANPNEPFVRRPSTGYRPAVARLLGSGRLAVSASVRYDASARFSGSGRLTSMAS